MNTDPMTHEEAMRQLQEFLAKATDVCEREPRNAEEWHMRASTKLMLMDVQEAERCYLKAIELDPKNAELWTSLGTTYELTQRYEEAERVLLRALEIDGQHWRAWGVLGAVYVELGRLKQAEEALRESQEFSDSLLQNSPHAVVVINPDTSMRYVNPAWEKLNGWTLSEIAGMKAPHPWWPEEGREAILEGFPELMKGGSGQGEIVAIKKNGEP